MRLLCLALLVAAPLAAQHWDPASRESPLRLLDAPADGVAWYERRLEAERLFDARRFAEAEPLLDRLAGEYARDPQVWRMLAQARGALGRHAEALPAYAQVGRRLGWDIENLAAYNVALRHLALGDRRAALDALRRAIFDHHGLFRTALLDWPQLAPLRDDPEFRALIGRPATDGWSRDRGWTFDLDLLRDELLRVHPAFRTGAPLPRELDARYLALRARIPRLTDAQVWHEMGRMLAVLPHGHVGLFELPGSRHLPLRFYVFPDGVYVVEGRGAHAALAGARVRTFGGVPAEEAIRRAAEAMPTDGEMGWLWRASRLSQVALLQAIGAAPSADTVTLTVEQGGAARSVRVATDGAPPAERQDRLPAPPGVAAPLFLRNPSERHWLEAQPAHDALYLHLSGVGADPDETLPQLGRRLRDTLARPDAPRHVILDLRHNNGGTTQQYPELLRTLVAHARDPRHRLYVLIGRRTYSAAANLITDLERLADPVFVGESSSECCGFYGDPVQVRLPYSGGQAEITAYAWQLGTPGDRRRELSPHVPVQLTAADYFAGRDPALDAVHRLIARREAVRAP